MAAGVVAAKHALIAKLEIETGGTGVAIGFETKKTREHRNARACSVLEPPGVQFYYIRFIKK